MSDLINSESSLHVTLDVSETYQILDMDKVIENTRNPNIVNDANFQSLKRDIDKIGSNKEQPIIVRPHPTMEGKYEIVDGAHRYKAMSELGFEEIIVTIKNLSDKEARMKTISMNKFRGDFDNVQLAELLLELKNTYDVTDEELQGFLGYTPEEIKGYESLVAFDFDDYDEVLPEDVTKDEIPDEMHLSLTVEQRVIIDKTIELLGFDSSESITIACAYFLDKFNSGEIKQEDIRKLRNFQQEDTMPSDLGLEDLEF